MSAITIIGSRKINEDEENLLITLGAHTVMSHHDYYSGAAIGSDNASERGALAVAEDDKSLLKHVFVFLPRKNFERCNYTPATRYYHEVWKCDTYPSAKVIAMSMHPMLTAFRDKYGVTGAEYMMTDKQKATLVFAARNVYQILGPRMSKPTDLVVCCADGSTFDEKGNITSVDGGTGMAVRLAYSLGIPVLNTRIEAHRTLIEAYIRHPEVTLDMLKKLGRINDVNASNKRTTS